MTGASTCRRGIGKSFTPYVLRSIVFSPLRLVLKSHAVEGGSRLSKQWGERASWSKELDGKELRGVLGGKRNLEPRGSSFSGHRLPILLHRLQCGMLISKGLCSPNIPCSAVQKYLI